MAFVPYVLLLFSFSLCLCISTAQKNQFHMISLGSSLSPTSDLMSWPSPSGHFAFGFYQQGNGFAIGIWLLTQPENIVVWTANRNDPPISSKATLELTKTGIVRTENGAENLIFDLSKSKPVDSASMLDSGNFVIYGTNSTIVWQSFDYPTSTLLGGQNLSTDNALVSSMSNSDHSSGRFFLTMQGDGNLVAYPVNSSHESDDAYWAFPFIIFPSASVNLSLDYKGILYLKNDSSVKILANGSYSIEKKLVIYRATLDVDGIFRLYSHNFENNTTSTMSTEWEAMQDQCHVKGFCSFNSYCSSSLGGKGDCYCYPGFVSTGNEHKLLGCFQNLTEDACRRDLKIQYNMTYMENTWWADYPYTLLEQMAKEDCKRSCQEDCNCGAVLYASEKCHKYKLPLRYGRRDRNMSFAAYFKVILGSSEKYNSPAEIITKRKEHLILILGLSLGFLALFCFVLAVSSFLMYRYQVHSYRKLSENGNVGLSEEFALRSFSYRELEDATIGFKEELGRGSFGAVYRGTLQGGNKIIAVKRLEKVVEEAEREFQSEMTAIARTHHRNLVQLLGFCVENTKKLLVYEYMKNGSLADILFKADVIRPIWRDRVRIALDIARGIFYLHEECEVRIIHCNIKPQNILIDDTWTAKISDFGLAKLLVPNQPRTDDKGVSESGGYLAPEWQKNSLISLKVDIYSFGVVLLEIICCRRNIELNVSTEDEIILSNWAYNCFVAGDLHKLVKDEDVDLKTLERTVKVGLWCTQDDPILRPSMKEVILMLEGTMNVPDLPSPAFLSDNIAH